ncbi:MAG: AAA family ATPase [Pyrinomonadaceae bacterium]
MDSKTRARELQLRITKVFLPGTAISSYDWFVGRQEQMTRAMSGVLQPGRHVILFGERGVGKTSLAKVLVESLHNDGCRTLETMTINCDESDDFTTLWRKIFRVLPSGKENGKTVYMDRQLPVEDVDISPDDVRHCLSGYREPFLIVIDEVDQLTDHTARKFLAATIKNLSDHSANTTLMLVGVADTVDELIQEHQSIVRSLIQVQMPRMSREEIIEIVKKRFQYQLDMSIDAEACNMIALFSRGFPFYAHSFGLYAGQKALGEGRLNVTRQDVGTATADVALNAFNLHSAYHRATMSPQPSNRYDIALIACALARSDDHGFFSAADVRRPLSVLLNKTVDIPGYKHYLIEFCGEKRRQILQPIGEKGRMRYRFRDPLMLPFVIINAFGHGKLDMNILEAISRPETIH